MQDLTSGKGAELVFDDDQGITGMYVELVRHIYDPVCQTETITVYKVTPLLMAGKSTLCAECTTVGVNLWVHAKLDKILEEPDIIKLLSHTHVIDLKYC